MNAMHVCTTRQSVAVGSWANPSSTVTVNVGALSDALVQQATDNHNTVPVEDGLA